MGPYLAQPITQKKTKKGQNLKKKTRYSLCQMQGWRRYMQDSAICELQIKDGNMLFGVFDGHGGMYVAKLVEKLFVSQLTASKLYKDRRYAEALIDTFKNIDEIIISKEGEQQLKSIKESNAQSVQRNKHIAIDCGCTANVVLITPNKIYTANAGDSRAALCRKGNTICLSQDHKPQKATQIKRINNAGGYISNGRVNGGLNLTRSFGDFKYKSDTGLRYDEQLITCKPDITEFDRNHQHDQFIIMGCDGIWERYVNDSQSLVTRVWNEKKLGNDGLAILKGMLDSMLARDTSEQIGHDNMTAILIEFL